MDDDARRREEHRNACWQGCDDLHDDDVCEVCGDLNCPGCWGDEPDDDAGHGDDWPPGVVDAPDISLYDPAVTQPVAQDTGGAR